MQGHVLTIESFLFTLISWVVVEGLALLGHLLITI